MTSNVLDLSGWSVDLGLREVRRDDDVVNLTPREVALLAYLVQRDGEPVSRESLLQDVFGYSPRVVSRAVDFTVHRLRKKIERVPTEPAHLLSIPSVGYRLAVDVPPLAPQDDTPGVAPPHNLPGDATAFVGRARELAEAWSVLERSRLVTLVGPGGVGKTRSAIALARRWHASRQQAVVLCDLTETRTLDGACAVVGDALALPPLGDEPVSTVGAALRRQPTLLVLDNLEQVVEPAAHAIGAWLAAAPDLRVLGTSRERLRVSGEATFEVPPMSLDDGTALFVSRSARPASEALPALLAALDGLPLAIELAAARSAVLSPAQLLERVAAGRGGLGAAPRGTHDRHANLEHAFLWSWNLLADVEQTTLAQLSVFRGGFDIAAAEAVVALPQGVPPVVDVVQSLRDKSLLRAVNDDPPRFDLLSSVRELASARSTRPQHTQARHAGWVVALATAAAGAVDAHSDAAAARALAREHENLLAAIAHLAEAPTAAIGEGDLLGDAVVAARHRWFGRGTVAEYLERLETTLSRDDLSGPARMRLRLARARVCTSFGRSREMAKVDCSEAARLAQSVGDSVAAARAHLLHAALLRQDGDLHEAWACHGEAAALLEYEPAGLVHAQAEMDAANLCCIEARFDRARAHYDAALDLCAAARNPELELKLTLNYAIVLQHEGRATAQRAMAQRALASARALGEVRLTGKALLCLAEAEADLGERAAASRYVAEALGAFARVGDRWLEGETTTTAAVLALADGEIDESASLLRRGRAALVDVAAPQAFAAAWAALVAWARWGSASRVIEALDAALAPPQALLPAWREFFTAKRLVARLWIAPEAADELEALLEGRVSSAVDPASRRAVEVDLGHVWLARARCGPVSERERNLESARSALVDDDPRVRVACARILLASAVSAVEGELDG